MPKEPSQQLIKKLPNLRRRLASMIYDGLLVIGVLSFAFLLPQVALAMSLEMEAPKWALLIHVFLVLGLYFIWQWHHGGQTLAMQTWKLRITATNGQQPSLKQLALRYVLAWPSLIFYGTGLIWSLFDRDRQYLHDRLAGTRIESTN